MGAREGDVDVGAETRGLLGANKLEQLMLYYVLPALGVLLLFTSLRAWHRQHKRESQ